MMHHRTEANTGYDDALWDLVLGHRRRPGPRSRKPGVYRYKGEYRDLASGSAREMIIPGKVLHFAVLVGATR